MGRGFSGGGGGRGGGGREQTEEPAEEDRGAGLRGVLSSRVSVREIRLGLFRLNVLALRVYGPSLACLTASPSAMNLLYRVIVPRGAIERFLSPCVPLS